MKKVSILINKCLPFFLLLHESVKEIKHLPYLVINALQSKFGKGKKLICRESFSSTNSLNLEHKSIIHHWSNIYFLNTSIQHFLRLVICERHKKGSLPLK